MRSPIKGLPDLAPELPLKDVRLTLSPVESVALYCTLENAIECMEQQHPEAPEHIRVMLSCLQHISDSLADRFTFREVH